MKFRAKKLNHDAWLIEFRLWWLPIWLATPIMFKQQKEAQLYVYEMNKEYGYESK